MIGAGVQGCAVAWRLAQAGRSVVVLERAIPGAEASSAAGGILSPGVEALEPGPFYALGRASLARYPAFVAELEAETGLSLGHRGGGTLEVAFDDDHAQAAGRAGRQDPVGRAAGDGARRRRGAPARAGALARGARRALVRGRGLARSAARWPGARHRGRRGAGARFVTGQVLRHPPPGRPGGRRRPRARAHRRAARWCWRPAPGACRWPGTACRPARSGRCAARSRWSTPARRSSPG